MSTTQDIKDVWRSNVFLKDEIQAFTDKIIDYDLLLDAESQQRKIRVAKYISVVIYRVTRSPKVYQLAGNRVYRYQVEISYYVERQPDSSPREAIERFFEALDEAVNTHLGYNWGGTVTRGVASEDVLEIDEVDLGGSLCLVGTNLYTAEKHFTE